MKSGGKPVGSTGVFEKGGRFQKFFDEDSDLMTVQIKGKLKGKTPAGVKSISNMNSFDAPKGVYHIFFNEDGSFTGKYTSGDVYFRKPIDSEAERVKTIARGLKEPLEDFFKQRGNAVKLNISSVKVVFEWGGQPISSGDVTQPLYEEGGDVDTTLIEKIKAILDKNLPGFFTLVGSYTVLGRRMIKIIMAASGNEINRVNGQYAQKVSLSLDPKTWELQVQVYGGSGGGSIYRKPNMDDNKEKYLAMKSEKIPFRKPKNNEESVLKAIDKFSKEYKNTLIEFKDRLMFKDVVDYDSLLGEKFESGGIPSDRVDEVLKHYVATALWSTQNIDHEEEHNLDEDFEYEDIDQRTLDGMRADVERFLSNNADDIEASGLEDSQIGHSLWLSRNGHGAGFFDFSSEEADRLQEAASELGGTDLYPGNDGKIHAMQYSKGGDVNESTPFSKIVEEVPADQDYPSRKIIAGVTDQGEIVVINIDNGIRHGNRTPYLAVTHSTVEPYTYAAAKAYAKQYWIDFFEDEPYQMQDMNKRMGTNFRTPAGAAKYVLDTDGELHGFDEYNGFGNVMIGKTHYVFHYSSLGTSVDDLDRLTIKYISDDLIDQIKKLHDEHHLKDTSGSDITIPVVEQNVDAILADAIEKIKKKKFETGGVIDDSFYEEGGSASGSSAPRIANEDAMTYAENTLPFIGNNIEGKFLSNGDYAILSMGYYPIWLFCNAERKWYGNSDKLSLVTAKHITQTRPDANATILSHEELVKKMNYDNAKYDLGGIMLKQQFPMSTDNTSIAHAGSAIASQQQL